MQLFAYPNRSVCLHAQLSAHDAIFLGDCLLPSIQATSENHFIEQHMFVPSMVRICLFQLVAVRPWTNDVANMDNFTVRKYSGSSFCTNEMHTIPCAPGDIRRLMTMLYAPGVCQQRDSASDDFWAKAHCGDCGARASSGPTMAYT